MRRSQNLGRNNLNHQIKDVCETGQVIDPFHSETAKALSAIDSVISDVDSNKISNLSHELKIGASIEDSRLHATPMATHEKPDYNKPSELKYVFIH